MPIANVFLKIKDVYEDWDVAAPYIKVNDAYVPWVNADMAIKADGVYDSIGHTLPVNLTMPTIAGGNLEPGNTLTVTPGTWDGNPIPTITHQWHRAGVPIAGATGLIYIIQEADRTFAVTCVETATNTQGAASATSNALTIPIGLTNVTLPSIAGSSTPGSTLTVTPGTWTGNPAPTITHQWERDGSPIGGATGLTYVVQSADRGFPITCDETAINSQGEGTVTSNAITPAKAPVNTVAVTIIGAGGNVPGTALSVVPGTWGGYPVPTLTYQWKRDGGVISGATGLSYIVQEVDRGYEMTCSETGTNTEGHLIVTSNVITIPVAPSNTLEPVISCVGVEEPGNTITVTLGVWEGYPIPALTHQWKRAGVAIVGETGLTYVIQEADRELEITCDETGTNSQGQATAGSNAILITPDQEAPANTVAPTITGSNLEPGNTLTVTPGTWTGTPVPTLTHHWERGGVVIGGATALTYVIQEADRNHAITCVETATNTAGSVEATSNAITIPIAPENTASPSIAGADTNPGTTLTVTPGTWTGYPAPVLTYQWERAGSPIGGATGLTYVIQAADQGYAITCDETGTNSAGSVTETSNALSIPGVLPANTVAPSISSPDLNPGTLITAVPGTWTGIPTPTITYQWKRDGVVVGGGTSTLYVISEADAGAVMTYTETATNSAGSASATSNGLQMQQLPINTVAPNISGPDLIVGGTLTTDNGVWDAYPTPTFMYRWERAGAAIDGATASTYVIQQADGGLPITCVVTAMNSVGNVEAISNTISMPVFWTPAQLFANGEEGFWLDGSDLSTMFQESTGVTPITASGQLVGLWKNKMIAQARNFDVKTGLVSARPLFDESGLEKRSLVFDGSNDQLLADTVTTVSLITAGTLAMGQSRTSNFTVVALEVSASPAFLLSNRSDGTILANLFGKATTSSNTISLTSPNVIVAFADTIGGVPVTVRLNGVETVGDNGSQDFNRIRTKIPGAVTPCSFSQIVYVNRILTPTEIDQLEAFIASKQ